MFPDTYFAPRYFAPRYFPGTLRYGCPGTAIISRSGIGTAVIYGLTTAGANAYTAIIARSGVGSATIETGCNG